MLTYVVALAYEKSLTFLIITHDILFCYTSSKSIKLHAIAFYNLL